MKKKPVKKIKINFIEIFFKFKIQLTRKIKIYNGHIPVEMEIYPVIKPIEKNNNFCLLI